MAGGGNRDGSGARNGQVTAAEFARLISWVPEIAEALLPLGTRREERGADWRFTHAGGLSISQRTGAWYRHSDHAGGYSPLKLIALLRDCSNADAIDWAAAWLAAHSGTGSCGVDDDDTASYAAREASAARTDDILRQCVSAAGTAAETYLHSRGITLVTPLPDSVRFLADARIGESALVALLQARDVVIGVHCIYLDAFGRKSLRPPVKQTFKNDRTRGAGAVCVLQESAAQPNAPDSPILIAEGIEDGLSLLAAGRTESVWGAPGVDVLAKLEVPRGRRVIVVRDGDVPGSMADKGLIKGLDHLLLTLGATDAKGEATVRLTRTPLGEDANAILRYGTDAAAHDEYAPDTSVVHDEYIATGAVRLNWLIDHAVPATLSFEGHIQKLAALQTSSEPDDVLVAAQLRGEIKQTFGVNLEAIDQLIRAQHKWEKPEKAPTAATANGLVLLEPDPWPDPVRLVDVLQALRQRIGKHVYFPQPAYGMLIALWIAHTYVYTAFQYTPRLAIDSPQPRCGKTTLNGILELTTCRPVPADGLTPASLVRLKAASGDSTVLLDEMGDALVVSPELDQVLRSGFQRDRRYIRLQPQPDGTFVHEAFDVYQPVAISLVGALRGALADRSIHIHMRRKPPTERLAKLRHGNNKARLLAIGRQLARWAQDDGDGLVEPAASAIPEAFNDRQGDFVVALLAIADQAGGSWPQEARQALVDVLADSSDQVDDDRIRLLRDIYDVFEADLTARANGRDPDKQEMESAALVSKLLQIGDAPWAQPETGRPLSQHKLAGMLRGFHIWPGNVGPENLRKRGYRRSQFTPAWSTYISVSPQDSPESECTSAQNGGNPPVSGNFQSAQEGMAVHSENSSQTRRNPPVCADVHSVPGGPEEKTRNSGQNSSSGTPAYNPNETNFLFPKQTGNDFSAQVVRARPSAIEQGIRDLAVAHPHWSEGRLAKASHQPVARVRRALKALQAKVGNGTDPALAGRQTQ